MITAIVLIRTEIDAINETAQALLALPGVTEVYSVTGEWELVVMVRARQHEQIAEVVTGSIARTEGVTETHTMVAFRAYAEEDLERLWSIGLEQHP